MSEERRAAATGLVGRQAELAVIDRLVDGLRAGGGAGRSAAILIQGPAGIGKTALWMAAINKAEAAGVSVLRARPAEAEATLAYSALADLLRDRLPHLLSRMPRQQRGVLELALGVSDEPDGTADPQRVQSAATSALLGLASEQPLLLAIDDAPWLDAASVGVLQFFARRIGSRPVAFAVTQRVEEDTSAPLGLDTAVPGADVERLWLEPLSVGALHRLLAERLEMTLPRPLLIRLHELSGGVPFHALEIARALRGKPLPPIGSPLPIPVSLRELLASRARASPAPVREVMLLVSAAGTLGPEAVERLLGTPAREGIAIGVDEGLLSTEGNTLRAGHPLVASVVYEVASPRQRRAAHAQLAEVIDEPEARARHRALATTGPDEQVAAELEAAGSRAQARGAPETAAELYRLARERTPASEREGHARRSLALAEALSAAADLPAAQQVLDQLIPNLPPGRMLAQARIDRAEIEWYTGLSTAAVEHLEAGLHAAAGQPDLEADIHYRLAIFCDYDQARALEHARKAVALLEGLDRPSVLSSALMMQFYGEIVGGAAPRTELLERALEIEPPDTPDANTIQGVWPLALDRPDEARRRFQTMLERDRRRGDLSAEADLLTRLAEVELFADRYAAAREMGDAATAAARQHGDESADPARRLRALADAHEGRLDEARALAEPSAARAAAGGDHIIAVAWLAVLALIAASERDYEAVDRYTAASEAHLAEIGIVEPLRLSVLPERLEALVALGRLEEAGEVLARLEERQARIPRPWLAAALARGRAELRAAQGDLEGAVAETDTVLGEGSAGWRRFDRARTLLVRGSLLRRARARREAADALDEAKAIFDEIGAQVWAARARTELERLGRRRPGTEELTPTEEQVARLAASGLTNREAAERLSVSPKTIEAHLARAYAKLGIRSRAELGRTMARR